MKRSTMHTFLVCAALAAATPACTPKQSPDELIEVLSKTGAKIEKDGSFINQPPQEMNLKLVVDGEDDFMAVRFPSTDLARDYCQSQKACFTVNYWSVVCETTARQSGPAWAKLLAAAGKPLSSAAATPSAQSTAAPQVSAAAESNCPQLDLCCSDALAPHSTVPPSLQYACSTLKQDRQRTKSCEEGVKAILDLYANPVTNTSKVKPPNGCAK